MKLKSVFAAIAATAALSGGVFLTETAQAKPCIFSQQGGVTDSTPSNSPIADPTTTQANFNGSHKMGIVGAGFVILGGFLAGGAILKRRFDRKPEPLIEEKVQTEALSEQLPETLSESLFASSQFAIEVPKEALESIRASEESELTSVR